ncbi:MAG: insulinase family protein [Crocinitomicaceae bacterium]|nr:insulinase family protein [Crocinitomicaceae bacterium]
MNRNTAPEIVKAKQLDLVLPQEIKLENDVTLFWMKEVKDESVKLEIEWYAGTKYQTKKLVAGFTNKLLLSGNATKSARTISEEIDFYGGFVQDEADKDHAAISIYGLRENISAIFRVFSDAFLSCEFPQKEFDEELNIALSRFKIDSEKVKFLCQRKFNACLFGTDNPYGQAAELSDFNALTREDLLAFYTSFYLNAKPVLFLVGDVDEKFIDEIRAWTSHLGKTKPVYEKKPAHSVTGRTYVEKKDAIQSAIRIGRIAVNKKHEDYFGLQVLDTILGGYFGSRLMANIREDKGYTYGIGSAVAVLEDQAYFFVSTEVAKEVTEATIHEIYVELDRLKNEPIPADELERVKNYMLGEFLRQSDGAAAMMDSFKNIWFNELNVSYYNDFIQAIHKITSDDLMNLAKKYFDRAHMVEVVAG